MASFHNSQRRNNMPKAIEVKAGGIKCDNKNCDYVNRKVRIKDYPNWVNKPCPKCGENLLTVRDYKTLIWLLRLVKILNLIFPASKENTKKVKVIAETDGNGRVFFTQKE